ncbi:hypothetical protein G6F57_016960 [Rhizopus arrhizus]|nr:hypothetical protein G6F57_016960 [Rhizopus arrhizus]
MPLPTDMQLPIQASGTRPSRALPYELHVSARCSAEGMVELLFSNTGKQAAVYHVYDQLNLARVPRRYVVEAEKSISDIWNAFQDNLGRYDLWVLGPNGLHRHFKGDTNRIADTDVAPEIRVCYDIANGDVYAELINTGAKTADFTVTAMAYRQDGPWREAVAGKAKASLHWSLEGSAQWYDFAVTCASDPTYYRRFAWRVETGKHTVSDPAMGA